MRSRFHQSYKKKRERENLTFASDDGFLEEARKMQSELDGRRTFVLIHYQQFTVFQTSQFLTCEINLFVFKLQRRLPMEMFTINGDLSHSSIENLLRGHLLDDETRFLSFPFHFRMRE